MVVVDDRGVERLVPRRQSSAALHGGGAEAGTQRQPFDAHLILVPVLLLGLGCSPLRRGLVVGVRSKLDLSSRRVLERVALLDECLDLALETAERLLVVVLRAHLAVLFLDEAGDSLLLLHGAVEHARGQDDVLEPLLGHEVEEEVALRVSDFKGEE